jgi:hypothetical protein
MDASSQLRNPRSLSKVLSGALSLAICAAVWLQPITALAKHGNRRSGEATVTVMVTPGHPANTFIPSRALGAGVDGHDKDETLRQLSPANVAAMLSAGLKPLTYRLRTELAGEAWHWNPNGGWSDPAHHQGYWTSDSRLGEPIQVCYGYRLPRRGNTIDQANDDGYSRIDDGDPETFWKSNPYLDEHFTGEKNSFNPQWVMIDLGAPKRINAIKILWAKPFAVNYTIEYGRFVGEEDLSQRLPSEWHAFPNGRISKGAGGEVLLRLSAKPIVDRYIRIRLNESSGRGPDDSGDIRDRLGYAIREVYVGSIDQTGAFSDVVRHGPSRNGQTVVYVSSTDPWHREIDRDDDTEQPGFDFIFESGLTNGLPVLLPVAVLYDVPENAAAEIQYLHDRGYPVERIEMGEEPDGQFVTPAHYGALYLQFVNALRPINPRLQFGGPSLQDIEQTQVPGRVEFGKGGWMGAFLSYLKDHGRQDDFSFFSFEWYPFGDDCKFRARHLAEAPDMLASALRELEEGGLSQKIPWMITEYGYSAFGARAEVDLDGALLDADSVARFLTFGGEAAYLYGYEASQVIKEQKCTSGNNMLFFRNDAGYVAERAAVYWGARLLTQEWVQPGDQPHEIYPALLKPESKGPAIVTAYAVKRPDGQWSVLLINKDPKRAHQVHLQFHNTSAGSDAAFVGRADLFQFSPAQYQLNSDPNNPFPIRSDPPVHTDVRNPTTSTITLPAYSMTVVRGSINTRL